MLPCREIVKIINAESKSVPFLKKMELKMHLFMCQHCSAYSKHIKLLKQNFKVLFSKLASSDPATIDRIENMVIEKIKNKN